MGGDQVRRRRRHSPPARRSRAVSTGSFTFPSTIAYPCGLPTVSLEPLSPHQLDRVRPAGARRDLYTSQVSGRAVGRTRSETLPMGSWSSLPFSIDAVSLSPSRPRAAGVDPDCHRQARLVDGRPGRARVSSGSASVSPIVTSGGRRRRRSRPAGLARRPGRAPRWRRARDLAPRARSGRRGARRPAGPCGYPCWTRASASADVGRRVEVRHERLQRIFGVVLRRRDRLEQKVEERLQVVGERVRLEARAVPRAFV